MNNRLILLLIFGIIFTTSCNNAKIQKTVSGVWSIDTVYYGKYDVMLCFSSNMISFNKNETIEVPIAMDDCSGVTSKCIESSGKWEIVKSKNANDTIPYRLNISSKNKVYNGIHKIIFYKDEINKLLKMEIWSDSLYIVCRKGLFNFDNNFGLINDLERISWTTRPK